MVFDQAQSPRLGQRTPVESTSVRMFSGDEIPEAAWPGQLIYRNEDQILQIYNGDAWEDVTGGDLGQLTFVGSSIPVSQNAGDVWFNSADSNRMYVAQSAGADQIATGEWEAVSTGVPPITATTTIYRQDTPPGPSSTPPPKDNDFWYETPGNHQYYYLSTAPGTHWVSVIDAGIAAAQATANVKTRVYYADGFEPDPLPGDPDHVSWVPLTTTAAGVTSFTTGDLWYQTDDQNHPYFWNGSWTDIKNPQIDYSLEQTGINAGDIADLSLALENLSITASSAQNTADTADGRVSMSDYMPGTDDVTYLQLRTDPVTGEVTEVETPRQNGSIWFTRTRPRRNLCTNPSLEINTNFWTSSQATIVRDNPPFVPAGLWTLKVTNSGTAGPHSTSWSEAARQSCVDSVPYTASVYAELVSGHGVGVQIQILWYDSGGSLISTSSGDPTQLPLGGFDPTLSGTGAEPRLWVTDIAPATAVSFFVRVLSPSGNEGDVWHCGALLVEQEDDLGRYFDGDSYDGFWDDVVQNSSSYLEGDKITQLWELRDGDWIRKYLTNNTLWFIDAAKLTGSMSAAILDDNTVAVDKAIAVPVLASETLAAGDLVNIWNNAGVFNMQRACAAAGTNYEAHGFVLDPVTAGTFGKIYHVGYNPLVINLAPGSQWLSTSPGQVTRTPPSAVGTLVQRVGHAPTDAVLNFAPTQPIKIT